MCLHDMTSSWTPTASPEPICIRTGIRKSLLVISGCSLPLRSMRRTRKLVPPKSRAKYRPLSEVKMTHFRSIHQSVNPKQSFKKLYATLSHPAYKQKIRILIHCYCSWFLTALLDKVTTVDDMAPCVVWSSTGMIRWYWWPKRAFYNDQKEHHNCGSVGSHNSSDTVRCRQSWYLTTLGFSVHSQRLMRPGTPGQYHTYSLSGFSRSHGRVSLHWSDFSQTF